MRHRIGPVIIISLIITCAGCSMISGYSPTRTSVETPGGWMRVLSCEPNGGADMDLATAVVAGLVWALNRDDDLGPWAGAVTGAMLGSAVYGFVRASHCRASIHMISEYIDGLWPVGEPAPAHHPKDP